MREKQHAPRRFSKKTILLTVCIALAVVSLAAFGVISFFEETVAFEYASVAPSLRVEEQQNGQVDFWAELPPNTGIHQTSAVVALDHETDTAYMQYTVYVSARRKCVEFDAPAQTLFFTRDADGAIHDVATVKDENGNYTEYRKVIHEIRYAIFDANGLAGITYRETPITLWSFALPESAVKPES